MNAGVHNILVIDTASDGARAILLQRGRVVAWRALAEKHAAQQSLNLCQEALADGKLRARDLDLLAVNCGPGSFTGIRIGVAVTQGLAYAARCQVIALSALELFASSVPRNDQVEPVLVAIASVNDEFFLAGYEVKGTQVIERLSQRVVQTRDLGAIGQELLAISPRWSLAGEPWFNGARLEALGGAAAGFTHLTGWNPASIQQLAHYTLGKIEMCERLDATSLMPNYLKESIQYKQAGAG